MPFSYPLIDIAFAACTERIAEYPMVQGASTNWHVWNRAGTVHH